MPAKPCPEVPHLHVFWTPPGMVTPLLPWEVAISLLSLLAKIKLISTKETLHFLWQKQWSFSYGKVTSKTPFKIHCYRFPLHKPHWRQTKFCYKPALNNKKIKSHFPKLSFSVPGEPLKAMDTLKQIQTLLQHTYCDTAPNTRHKLTDR